MVLDELVPHGHVDPVADYLRALEGEVENLLGDQPPAVGGISGRRSLPGADPSHVCDLGHGGGRAAGWPGPTAVAAGAAFVKKIGSSSRFLVNSRCFFLFPQIDISVVRNPSN